MISRTDKLKKQFPEILKNSMGIVTTACKQAGLCRDTYYSWRQKDKKFRALCDAVYEERKDFVESKLLQKISDGDTTCIIFYLKTQAKDRGYVERVEATGKNGEPIKFLHGFEHLSKEQIDDIIRIRDEG